MADQQGQAPARDQHGAQTESEGTRPSILSEGGDLRNGGVHLQVPVANRQFRKGEKLCQVPSLACDGVLCHGMHSRAPARHLFAAFLLEVASIDGMLCQRTNAA